MSKHARLLAALARPQRKPAPAAEIDAGMTHSEAAAAFYGDEQGRVPEAQAAKLLSGIRVEAQEERWTFETVKAQLREMAQGVQRLVRHPGPSSGRGFWPDWALYADVTDADRNTIYEGLRDGTRAPDRISLGVGDERAITRIEEAIEWPWRYLSGQAHNDERDALHIWLNREAFRQSFDDAWRYLGCGRATAYERRDRAIRIILAGLERDGR